MTTKVLQKIQRLTNERYYEVHLAIINALLPVQLTHKELEVLAHFMSLPLPEKDRFGTTARKTVKTNLNLSDGGLGNYLKAFKTKGFIIPKEDGFELNPLIAANSNEQFYQFKLENIDGVT